VVGSVGAPSVVVSVVVPSFVVPVGVSSVGVPPVVLSAGVPAVVVSVRVPTVTVVSVGVPPVVVSPSAISAWTVKLSPRSVCLFRVSTRTPTTSVPFGPSVTLLSLPARLSVGSPSR
jgi:hypothetical protein